MLGFETPSVLIHLPNGNVVFTDGCRLVQGGSGNVVYQIFIDRPGREPVEVLYMLRGFTDEELIYMKSIHEKFGEEISLAFHEGRAADLRTITFEQTTCVRLETLHT
jgi:hypothetical protein